MKLNEEKFYYDHFGAMDIYLLRRTSEDSYEEPELILE